MKKSNDNRVFNISEYKIGVIGLGYVGLPIAIAFGKHTETIGYDIDSERVRQLNDFNDSTGEVTHIEIEKSKYLSISSNKKLLEDCNCYIVTVPTPVDKNKKPDLSPLISACNLLSEFLKKNDIVIFESTVYPGCTEEVCVPIFEDKTPLEYNKSFFIGYSPERIVPGDKSKSFEDIIKVTSGSNENTLEVVNNLYKKVVKAGICPASSIMVAEASKAIENAQRDLNISFFNELAIMCSKLNINTQDVIEAASSKWNFIKLKPGLVGGHCISVDPYYLIHKANEIGFNPIVINSGRKTNEIIASHIKNECVSYVLKHFNQCRVKDLSFLLLGFTFKPNCSDIRNTGVFKLYSEISKMGFNVQVYDPVANKKEVKNEYNIEMVNNLKNYNCIIYCVNHKEFSDLDINNLKKSKDSIIYDVTGSLNKELFDFQL